MNSGDPLRRSSTRDWLSRDEGDSDMALGPLEFSWLSMPL
jgi:hypothetical protein